MQTCDQCREGPSGIEGHEDLFVQTMAGSQLRFRCRACGALWVRHYAGEGGFSWLASQPGEKSGIDCPGHRT